MTRRSDADIDLEKYKPSIEASLQLCDENAAEERLRKAFENPELRALLAAEGRAVEFTPVPPAPAPPRARTTDPISAQPQVPPAPMKEAAPPKVAAPAPGKKERPPKREPGVVQAVPALPVQVWTPTHKALAAILLAFLPAMVVIVLFVRPHQPGMQNAAMATGIAAPAPPPASAATVAPSAPAAAPSPLPSVTSAPTTQPSAQPSTSPSVVKPRPRTTLEDPYDAAPPPPVVTAEPAPTAAPSASEAPPPSPSAPFLIRKREP
jgi:hypothetical protein